ncbi:hypothetical protein [Halofilum ochraceum]|uniref:hypothetical protein n=1 Tax=Halofilum ochraceum TaxID=1611323 RepID=UPI0008D95FC3|nr:hypothetical protein [Halofilum ochraceum]
MADREPSVAELANRQERVEREQRDVWDHIHAMRDRVAANEQGMERLWSELHAFRTESREDAKEVTSAIGNLGERLASKADTDSDSWRRKVDEALSARRGGLSLARWIVGLGIPALGVLATIIYYAEQVLS